MFFLLSIVSLGLLLAIDLKPASASSSQDSPFDAADKKTALTPITALTTAEEVVNHPAFRGFGRLVLPLEGSRRPPSLPLKSALLQMLPYHNNVVPTLAVDVLNHMIAEVAAGRRIFYDLYTKNEKQAEPTRESTGLFFFEGRPGAPTAIICAGGGFQYVGSIHEGFPHAIELSRRGYNAIVVKYRIDMEAIACEDLARAISVAFLLTKVLNHSMEGYSLWGSSAGARVVARLASDGTKRYRAPEYPKPSAVIMAYTGHSDLAIGDPPTFAVVGEDDAIADPEVMRRRIRRLKAFGVDAELHVFPDTRHGFGLGFGTPAEGWLDLAVAFWERQLAAKPLSGPIP
ncbi:MAG: alpha/beta hydrolase [Deltaproteobacteria bacterium]|jgi:acetyl esterase/lipase|nr:alpha/beta hydrolase [Deltaproteobacteria bacterium]